MTDGFYGATSAATAAISRLLNLPVTGREQDWELEFADAARLSEMLDVADGNDLDLDQKNALALIILASVDEGPDLSPGVEARVRQYLARDETVRDAMRFYWIGQSRASSPTLIPALIGT